MDITSLRSFTNLQTKFMFLAKLEPIADLDFKNFTILARSTSILGKRRNKVDYKFLGRQMSIPVGIAHDGSWNVTMILDEGVSEYQKFVKWFYYIDNIKKLDNEGMNADFKTNGLIKLMKLDGKSTNTVYALLGCYIGNLPNLDGLSHDDNSGHITFTANLYIDDVAHGVVDDGGNIKWLESDDDIYYPYKDELLAYTNISTAFG